MPDKQLIAFAIEALLILGGIVALWRCVLSPAARARTRGPQPLPHWNIPGYAFAFAALRVIGVALAVQIFAHALIKRQNPGLSLADGFGLFLGGMIFQGSVLLGVGVAWYFLKSSRFVAELNAFTAAEPVPPPPLAWAKVPVASFALFTLILVVITPFSLVWPWLLERAGHTPAVQDAAELFAQADSPLHISLLLLVAVVIAPFMEELVFRAGLFRFMRGRLPRAIALLVPAALFAALHANLTVALPLLVFGLIQSFAYERTGRLTVPIIAHGLFNLHTGVMILAGVDPYDFLSRQFSP